MSTSTSRARLVRRAELVADQLAHLPHGTRRRADAPLPVRLGASGTGPDLLVLAWSADALARERAAGVRVLGRLGIRPGMRVANTLAGALVTPGALLLGDVIEELGGLDVPLGAIDGDAAARGAWALADRVEPDVLVLEEATAARLFAAAPAGSRPWLRGIVWCRRAGAASVDSPVAPAGFAGWQRTWLAVPEASSFVAGSCGAGRFHLDDAVAAEVVDDATGAPATGRGTLVLTTRDGDAPLERYATGVAARAGDAHCPCGAAGATVELE